MKDIAMTDVCVNFRWKRLRLQRAQLFRKKQRKTLVYDTLTEAGAGKARLGGGKSLFFSEGDYHIETSSYTFQKYAQRVPLGKIIILKKKIKTIYKKRKKLEHLKSWHLKIFEIEKF